MWHSWLCHNYFNLHPQILMSVLAMSLIVCLILSASTVRVITPAPVIMALLETASLVVKVSCVTWSLN